MNAADELRKPGSARRRPRLPQLRTGSLGRAPEDYAGADWRVQLTLWRAYNLHLARIIERIPEVALNRRCRIGTEGALTLGEIVEGYVIHLRHHLGQLLPD